MSAQQHPEAAPAKRNRVPLILLAVLLIGGIAFGIHYAIVGRNHATTDDAYVDGNLVRLTPQVGGTVIAINADETQFVQQGQLLVQLDPRDSEVALAQAKASLGQTVREVAQLFAEEQRDEATLSVQRTQYEQASQDLARDQTLDATRAAVSGTTPQDHPRVLQAEASLRNAWLAAARTRVLSPVSGYVVRRAVQLGQQVTPGTEMLAIVPMDSVWIDANFKENQLNGLRIGQPVKVSTDMYGSHVEYHGSVQGLTAGTGSALAVLPAQNASGNWIKIVQRLPVRIGLDPQELAQHPLFLGLSTSIDVDIHDHDGAVLSKQPTWPSALSTDVYTAQDAGVDEAIHDIVSHNLGLPLTTAQAVPGGSGP
jgi:membrane fusion protein (multidrug efflux system)